MLSVVDARPRPPSVLALAERLGTTTVITFDRRHFGALRTASGESLTLLPDAPA